MPVHPPTRAKGLLSLAVFLLLSGAVFGWGLHYKLSLYRVAPAHSSPAAKLLSERERPAVKPYADGARPAPPAQGTELLLIGTAAVFVLLLTPPRSFLLAGPGLAAGFWCTEMWAHSQFMRPPPAFVLSR